MRSNWWVGLTIRGRCSGGVPARWDASTRGFTVVELIVVVFIVGILASIVGERFVRMRDVIAVHGAANDAEVMFAAARQLAIVRGERTVVEIDTGAKTLTIRVQQRTVRARAIGEVYGVTVKCSRSLVTYAPNGMGFGVSNLTLVVSKGRAVDTMTISRLGRVKRTK